MIPAVGSSEDASRMCSDHITTGRCFLCFAAQGPRGEIGTGLRRLPFPTRRILDLWRNYRDRTGRDRDCVGAGV